MFFKCKKRILYPIEMRVVSSESGENTWLNCKFIADFDF